jgi:hypothetical protein
MYSQPLGSFHALPAPPNARTHPHTPADGLIGPFVVECEGQVDDAVGQGDIVSRPHVLLTLINDLLVTRVDKGG